MIDYIAIMQKYHGGRHDGFLTDAVASLAKQSAISGRRRSRIARSESRTINSQARYRCYLRRRWVVKNTLPVFFWLDWVLSVLVKFNVIARLINATLKLTSPLTPKALHEQV